MKAEYFDEKNVVNENEIDKVAKNIMDGKIAVFPT